MIVLRDVRLARKTIKETHPVIILDVMKRNELNSMFSFL